MDFPLDEKRANDAYEALVKFLAVRARSEKECREKLYSKGFHKDEVEFAIEKAKGYKYINDEEFTRDYLTFARFKYGAKKLSYKLTAEFGLDKNLVENAIADLIDDSFEEEVCRGFAEKYIKQKHISDDAGARKLSAFLYQKGFEWNIINRVISDVLNCDSYDEI